MNRRKFLEYLGGTGSAALLGGCGSGSGSGGGGRTGSVSVAPDTQPSDTRPNVLFLSIDDLNHWIGALGGHPQTQTPNIDKLAEKGVLFTNAHCPAPVCDASRTSVLTGLRPSTTGIYFNGQANFRDYYPDLVTLPQYFRSHGYKTTGGGKLLANVPDPQSWDEYWPGLNRAFKGDPIVSELPANGLDTGSLDWGMLDRPEDDWSDVKLLREWAAPTLQQDFDRPFFMGVGVVKPHLRWYLPPDRLERFPSESTLLPEILPGDVDDLPDLSGILHASQYRNHRSIVAAGKWQEAVAAYLAALSFADDRVGELLDAYDSSPHAANTIFVLWSDNGFHLGEKELWRKNTLWRESTRVPLIIHDPRRDSAGQRCNRPVSLLDLYPTLAELCGLPSRPDLEGTSLVSLLDDPQAAWDRPAVTTRGPGNHAVITEEWRYVRYQTGAEELYELERDPHEWFNLADRRHLQDVKTRLATWLPQNEAFMR